MLPFWIISNLLFEKKPTSIWQQSTIMKQAKIIDSDNICTIVTQKGMWEKKYQSVHIIKKMILDTAVTSEDLSHTTMRKTIYVRKKIVNK